MNKHRVKLLSVTVLAVVATSSAWEVGVSETTTDRVLTPPGKSLAERSATLAERVKLGYESYGLGPRLNSFLHRGSDRMLRCLAETGDAGAAMALWHRLAGEANLARMSEAEDVALEQYRLLGHTFLIHKTAARYASAAAEQCGRSDGELDRECLAANQNLPKAAVWFKLGERLGDPVSAVGFSKLGRYAKQDAQVADRNAELLLARTQPLPDATERYAYQCADSQ